MAGANKYLSSKPSVRLRRLNDPGSSVPAKIGAAGVLLVLIALSGIPLAAQRSGGVHQDPAGEWTAPFQEDRSERGYGPEIGDYLGVPLNDAARFAADAWDAVVVGLPENMCKGHSADHSWREPATVRIWKEYPTEQNK